MERSKTACVDWDRIFGIRHLLVIIERVPKACALAQIWLSWNTTASQPNFVYMLISMVSAQSLTANFCAGTTTRPASSDARPISIGGPRCLCGLSGC